MTFDSNYRRKAMQIWAAEQSEAERELSQSVSTIHQIIRTPFQRLLTTLTTWFTLT